MCGICGYFEKTREVASDLLQKMNNTLVHRGPDNGAIWVERNIGLGHRRLSILDLSEAGHQPMLSFDNRYVLSYNGEVYNYLDLKQDLIQQGYVFKGHSDTEVILNGFHAWGTDVFIRLNGIFAIAVWDRTEKKLYIARDRYGVKPIYFYQDNNKFVFGSEIKAILVHSDIRRLLNHQSFHEFLYYGNAIGGKTLFKNIEKVLPGEYIVLSEKNVKRHFFWNFSQIEVDTKIPEVIAIQEVQQQLENAVKRQLASDVPVGVFLSGGIDSSAITAFASKHYRKQISTFSAAFDFEIVNELKKAKIVADYYGTQHHELFIKGGELPSIIDSLVYHHDEPFSDAANIPLYLLTKEVRHTHKVILQGDGGDEFFAGYRRYNTLSQLDWLYPVCLLTSKLLPNIAHPKIAQLKRFTTAVAQSNDALRMALLLTIETTYNPPTSILSENYNNLLSSTNPFLVYQQYDKKFKCVDAVQKMLWTDTQILLPETFLEKVDKSTMANGVEVRVPFLDNDLSNYALSLPSNLKIKNGDKKFLLKRALREIVPDKILDAPKVGFGVPYSNWLRKPLSQYLIDTINENSIRELGIFNQKKLTDKIKEHIAGIRDNGFLLWKVMNFCIWLKKYDVKIDE